MTEDTYTRPERAAEFSKARKRAKEIFKAGGCPACLNRVEGWGRAACGLTPQSSFPKCIGSGKFKLDEETGEKGA